MSYLWLAVGVAGVVWGLLMSDARPLERVLLALLWPLGPIAFAATITVLLAAALIAYALVSVPVLIATAIVWWVFS